MRQAFHSFVIGEEICAVGSNRRHDVDRIGQFMTSDFAEIRCLNQYVATDRVKLDQAAPKQQIEIEAPTLDLG